MNLKYNIRSKFTRRILLILVTLFIIPAIAVASVCVKYINDMRNNTLKNYCSYIDNSQDVISRKMDQLTIITFNIDRLENTRTSYMEKSSQNTQETMNLLSSIIVGNDDIKMLSLFYDRLDRVVGNKSTYVTDNFIKFVHDNNFDDILHNSRNNSIITSTVECPSIGSGVYFIYTVPTYSDYSRRVIQFFLPDTFFKDSIAYENIEYYIKDGAGNIIDYSNAGLLNGWNTDIKLSNAALVYKSVQMVNVNGKQYLYSVNEQKVTGLKIHMVVNLDDILTEIRTIRNVISLLIIFLSVIGVILIAAALEITYSPIRKIYNQLPPTVLSRKDDECDMILNHIRSLTNIKDVLITDLRNNKLGFLRYQLIAFLGDTVGKKELVLNNQHRYDSFLSNEAFLVLSIKIENERYDETKVIDYCNRYCFETVSHIVLGTEVIKNAYVMLLSYEGTQWNMVLSELKRFKEDLRHDLGLICIVCLSRKLEAFSFVSDEYLKVLATINKSEYDENLPIIMSDDEIFMNTKCNKYDYYLRNLDKVLSERRFQEVQLIMNTIVEEFEKDICSNKIGQFICLFIRYLIITHYLYLENDHDQAFLLDLKFNSKIESIKNKQLQLKYLDDAKNDFNIFYQYKTEEQANLYVDNLFDEMKKYIELNFTDPNFTIQMVADQFCMPISTLSRFFKQCSGTTISNWFFKLRIERSKELLADPKLTLSEIVAMIGYIDDSSFIRKFKTFESITPGQYRKRLQNGIKM